MKAVAGLGNPGQRYARTPHNAGFDVVDVLAGRAGAAWRRSLRLRARQARGDLDGVPCLLLQPQTYMNNSGLAVAAALRYHRLSLEDLVVVVDDADLPVGRLRIRPGGASGGHRGLESIMAHVGSRDFARVRVGVGRQPAEGDLVRHVLQPYSEAAWQRMREVVELAADAVTTLVRDGVDAAMNRYNGQAVGPAAAAKEETAKRGRTGDGIEDV